MLKAIESVKRYNRLTLIGALVTSYLHQAHYLATKGAGLFAYLPPAIFDTAMVSMLIVVRTHGIAKDAKRWAMAVFIGAALLSSTVNFAAPGDLGLRIVFALVVVLVIGVELVAGRIRPDFTAIDKQAAELLAAANKIKARTASTATTDVTTPADASAPALSTGPPNTPAPVDLPPAPAATAPTAPPAITDGEHTESIPARLVPAARMVIVQHRQTSAEPITVDELAARLGTSTAIAAQLLAAIDNPARINGNVPALGGAR
ncbi:DUF2637 domain-containing protein [Actinoplanes sp. TRM 88003]|uniref:DUF2637 domain-containing protein n=1 Tax=Paractinoplanes aksuensis TaxID=2939490 RepID=A0ABT1DP50_9ACTN|nr:DUF2637 domain-containing protein [Actinoplanes aksuensis]MCO8271526.1 DUF2637 domain-containing protein [Actinoplanes aksuensis]